MNTDVSTTWTDVKNAASKIGAKTERSRGRRTTLTAESPGGMIWNDNGLHCYVVQHESTSRDRRMAHDTLLQVIQNGVSPCDGVDCEYCHPVPEDEIGT